MYINTCNYYFFLKVNENFFLTNLIWYQSLPALFSPKFLGFVLESFEASSMAAATTTSSSSSVQDPALVEDISNLLFLHHAESPRTMLISEPLISENYHAWARSMKKALIAKNKFGFVNGNITLSSPLVKTPIAVDAWICFDNMVGSWLMKAMSPHIRVSITYRDTALEIWNNLRDTHSQGNGPKVFQL